MALGLGEARPSSFMIAIVCVVGLAASGWKYNSEEICVYVESQIESQIESRIEGEIEVGVSIFT